MTALRTVPVPAATGLAERPAIPAAEYDRRIRALYGAAAADWVVVYGDREHVANLAFVCGFDPRFEEALLLLGPGERRVLLVGNEGLDYVPAVVGLPLEAILCQSLSLMGQPRDRAPRLADVLRTAGVAPGTHVAVVGWKYLEADETDDPTSPAFVPAFLVAILRQVVGPGGRVSDATAALMHPVYGLKSKNGAAQI